MSHVRQQIRDEVVSRLLAQPGLTGRVEASRVYTSQVTPYVIVYTRLEEAQDAFVRTLNASQRELTLFIEVYSKAGTGVWDNQIDNICVQIEEGLANDGGMFFMAKTWEYRGINIEDSKDGEKAAGIATLEYVFTYMVSNNDPQAGV